MTTHPFLTWETSLDHYIRCWEINGLLDISIILMMSHGFEGSFGETPGLCTQEGGALLIEGLFIGLQFIPRNIPLAFQLVIDLYLFDL